MSARVTLAGWRAAQRRNEREVARRYRELVAQRAGWANAEYTARERYDAQVLSSYLEFVTTLHRDATTPVDWRSVLETPPPVAAHEMEQAAMLAYSRYQPTMVDRMNGAEAAHRHEFQMAIERGRAQDTAQHRQQYEEWDWFRRIAHGVLTANPEAYTAVLENLSPFEELEQSNAAVRCTSHTATYIEAFVTVRGVAAIPRSEKRLLASGKVSTKAIPDSKYWTYYQDYVCGAALRVARELFHLLPLETVCVHVGEPKLNTATGHDEVITILSVEFTREAFLAINFERADASDATESFRPNMKFKKTTGFAPVERLAAMTSIEMVG